MVICTNRGGRNQQIGLPAEKGEYTALGQGMELMEYRRQVAMRCDGEDFVISLQPEDEIVFRTKDARALRNLCRRLRWQIAIDTTLTLDGWTWPPETTGASRIKI
jgi:hypothetical protein